MVGTDDWFEEMFTRHAAAVLRYAQRRVTERPAASDVVAETFLTAWRLRSRRPDVVGEELPWLYGLALGVVRNQQRSTRRRLRLSDRLAAVGATSDTTGPDHSEVVVQAEHLRAGLAQLKPDDEELLRLVAWEGLGPAGVARVLGITPSAAGVRIHRARQRLRQALSDACPNPAAVPQQPPAPAAPASPTPSPAVLDHKEV